MKPVLQTPNSIIPCRITASRRPFIRTGIFRARAVLPIWTCPDRRICLPPNERGCNMLPPRRREISPNFQWLPFDCIKGSASPENGLRKICYFPESRPSRYAPVFWKKMRQYVEKSCPLAVRELAYPFLCKEIRPAQGILTPGSAYWSPCFQRTA